MAWREFFTYAVNFSSLAAGTGISFTPGVIKFDSDADFEFQKTVFLAGNGQIRVLYQDDTMGRYLTKQSVLLSLVASDFVGTPFIWPRPYQILAGTTFTVQASDASGIANQFLRLVFIGAKVRAGDPPWGHYDPTTRRIIWTNYKAIVPFVYNTGLVNVAANGVQPMTVSVDNDADFLVQKVTGSALGACLFDANEAATNKAWQNTAIPYNCFLGNGQFPNVLFSNRFVMKGSVVNINATDISGAANQVEVNLIGVKLFS